MQQGTSEKYAVGEYERRFLVDAVPAGVSNPRHIVDRYIDNTRMRLRSVASAEGDPVLKLGHKRRVKDDDPTQIMCTSMYLEISEFDALSDLSSRPLTKTRWAIDVDGTSCSVDEFTGDLAGLVMLEVDLHDPASLERFTPPSWAGPEVTYDETFTGGQLAGRRFEEIASVVDRLVTADNS